MALGDEADRDLGARGIGRHRQREGNCELPRDCHAAVTRGRETAVAHPDYSTLCSTMLVPRTAQDRGQPIPFNVESRGKKQSKPTTKAINSAGKGTKNILDSRGGRR
jgi:hypothetical protein